MAKEIITKHTIKHFKNVEIVKNIQVGELPELVYKVSHYTHQNIETYYLHSIKSDSYGTPMAHYKIKLDSNGYSYAHQDFQLFKNGDIHNINISAEKEYFLTAEEAIINFINKKKKNFKKETAAFNYQKTKHNKNIKLLEEKLKILKNERLAKENLNA